MDHRLRRTFDDLFHVTREEILEKTDHDLFKPETADTFRAYDLLAIEANRPVEFEEQVDLQDGTRTYLTVKFSLRDAGGRPYAVCGIATDITTRKRFEEELRSSVALLQRAERERDALLVGERQARAAAEEAVRLRDEFLSVASHELRTPLTSLQLAVAGLSRRMGAEVTPPVQRSLDLATRQLKRMGRLVGLLLDVSRIQAGRLELERREVDLGQLARETTLELAEGLRRSGSEVVLSTPEPVVGYWDPARIEQVIINLLTNAIKFGQGQPIDVRVEMVGDIARLTVRDRGIGIPDDVQPRVFERFGRGVSARHYGGLGLGLYIVRTNVLAHGGRVFVQSKLAEGACFTVELPKSDAAPARSEEPRATGAC